MVDVVDIQHLGIDRYHMGTVDWIHTSSSAWLSGMSGHARYFLMLSSPFAFQPTYVNHIAGTSLAYPFAATTDNGRPRILFPS